MVYLSRDYKSIDTVDRIFAYLDEHGLAYTMSGVKFNEEKGPEYQYDAKRGKFMFTKGVIEVPLPEGIKKRETGKKFGFIPTVKEVITPANFKVEVDVNAFNREYPLKISMLCPDGYDYKMHEIFDYIETQDVKGPEDPQEKFKVEFKGLKEPSENLMKQLGKLGTPYEITPRKGKEGVEYLTDLEDETRYLVDGHIEIPLLDISYDLEKDYSDNLVINASSRPNNRNMALAVLKQIGPQKVDTVERQVGTFKGDNVKLSGYSWEDLGGLEELKEEIMESIEWPLKNPEVMEYMGIRMPKGILLQGPPGTGKTLLAKIVASETDAYFFQASTAELTSKWYGESEKLIKELFDNARDYKPSIIYIDEIDGLFTSRDNGMHDATRRMLGVFLQELDGLEKLEETVLLASTNRPQDLDPAILRPGRFDRIIEVPMPDREGREKIFGIHTRDMPIGDIDFPSLAERTDGYSGAEIEALCQRAGYTALKRYMKTNELSIYELKGDFDGLVTIEQEDFEKVLADRKKQNVAQ